MRSAGPSRHPTARMTQRRAAARGRGAQEPYAGPRNAAGKRSEARDGPRAVSASIARRTGTGAARVRRQGPKLLLEYTARQRTLLGPPAVTRRAGAPKRDAESR